ncbi:MAG: TonB family protein [Desulfatibacillaceae bacterium]
MARERNRGVNGLLWAMVLVAAMAHVFVYERIAGLYESEAASYIELDLRQEARAARRNIPRPRPRPREIVPLAEPEHIVARPVPAHMPPPSPAESPKTSVLDVPTSLSKAPEALDAPALQVAGFQPGDLAPSPAPAPAPTGTRQDYFDTVRMRIESRKQYPRVAMHRGIEGRVVLRFTIFPDGAVSGVVVVRSSGFGPLDDAAMDAVRRSAPLSRPPDHLFKGPVPVEIAVVFELA